MEQEVGMVSGGRSLREACCAQSVNASLENGRYADVDSHMHDDSVNKKDVKG